MDVRYLIVVASATCLWQFVSTQFVVEPAGQITICRRSNFDLEWVYNGVEESAVWRRGDTIIVQSQRGSDPEVQSGFENSVEWVRDGTIRLLDVQPSDSGTYRLSVTFGGVQGSPQLEGSTTLTIQDEDCMVEYTTEAGSLQSDNYPLDYENNDYDSFWIHPAGRDFVLTILDLQTENGHDYLEVYNGRHNGNLIHNFTGVWRNFHIYNREFYLVFVTDGARPDRGFSVSWRNAVDIRLVGGQSPLEGRVEISINNELGTICDDFWDIRDAEVVCRMKGHGGGVALHEAYFGEGVGRIWLDDVQCMGNETDLLECIEQVDNVGIHNCDHFEDAGVRCTDVRLENGIQGTHEGRIGVFHNGQWGTVCDNGWDDDNAAVICSELGYTGGAALSAAYFGEGDGPIWLNNVACTGNESALQNCDHEEWLFNQCHHAHDASVRCDTVIRLMGGAVSTEGRVEILYNSEWGSVCGDYWSMENSQVVCRMLGLTGGETVMNSVDAYGVGTGTVWLDDVECVGTETSIVYCRHQRFGRNNCRHLRDVGVRCGPKEDQALADTMQVRLMGGTSPYAGIVEVFFNGTWGTVCNSFWDESNAQVVCRMLGYIGGTSVGTTASDFSYAPRIPIVMDNVRCTGSESTLYYCSNKGWGRHNCQHSDDAVVMCNMTMTTPASATAQPPLFVRLVDGVAPGQGRVEVYHAGEWGTICDDNWGDEEAHVVCRSLGYPEGFGVSQGYFGHSSSTRIWLDDVNCVGTENSLAECAHADFGQHNCRQDQDVGAVCIANSTAYQTGEFHVRLIGNAGPNTGRVEVYHNGYWGTVCSEGWDDGDAEVVCRELGYHFTNGAASTHPLTLDSLGLRTWMNRVNCSGSESSLADCPHAGWGFHDCSRHFDAGITCGDAIMTFPASTTTTTSPLDALEEWKESSGTIHSPSYPRVYPNGLRKEYWIHPGDGREYILVVNDFRVEAFYDYVVITEGHKGRHLADWSGTIANGTELHGTEFFIFFHSDGTIGREGFSISWQPAETLERAIVVTCLNVGMNVKVNLTMVTNLYPSSSSSDILLGDQCEGYRRGGTSLEFNLCYSCCYTHRDIVGPNFVFHNYVSDVDGPRGIVIRDYLWNVNIQCQIPISEHPILHLNPNVKPGDGNPTDSKGRRRRAVSPRVPNWVPQLQFFSDPGYTKQLVGNPPEIKAGEKIYTQVMVPQVNGTKLVVQSCSGNTLDSTDGHHTYVMIADRCPDDQDVQIISAVGGVTRFSFLGFHFRHSMEPFEIKCSVKFCASSDNEGVCAGCTQAKKAKRSNVFAHSEVKARLIFRR